MNKMIIGERLVKSYGEGDDRRVVLDGISVEVEEGEFVAVMGPSGSGKSTLLFALSGTDTVSSGTVLVDGKDLSSASEQELADYRRTRMGFVFQQPTLLGSLNILDNIMLPSLRDNRRNAEGVLEKARMLMKRTGIAELEKRGITEVSGGQLQRAGICRALMNNPRVIFGDEPTGALHSQAAAEIMALLFEINAEGKTMMLVTHDAKAAAWTERVLFMADGRIVDELKLPKHDGSGLAARVEQVTMKMVELGL